MLNFKVLFLAFLLLATNALAVRVTYSAKYTGQAVGERTQKLATVDDDKGEQILDHMSTWSGGKYTASRSTRVANMIIVVNVVEAASKGAASDMLQDMQTIVNHNYRPRSPSPGHKLKYRSPSRVYLN